jgi:peroxiredoxin
MVESFRQRGIRLVAISADTVQDSQNLVKRLDLRFPLLSDVDLKTAIDYGVAMKDEEIAIPATFIISKNGEIKWKHVGETKIDRPEPDQILSIATDDQ